MSSSAIPNAQKDQPGNRTSMLRRSALLLALLFVGQTIAMGLPGADAQPNGTGPQPCPPGTTGPGQPNCTQNPPQCDSTHHLEGNNCVPNQTQPASCPQGQTGTPPNCQPASCPQGQTGTPPNCQTPQPASCPQGQTGTPPNCHVPDSTPGCSPNCGPPPGSNSTTCAGDTHRDGDRCVPNTTAGPGNNTGIQCGPDQHPEGNPPHCVDNMPPGGAGNNTGVQCGPNQHPEGNPPHCADGMPPGGNGTAGAPQCDPRTGQPRCPPPDGNNTGGAPCGANCTPPPCSDGRCGGGNGTAPGCTAERGCAPGCTQGGAAPSSTDPQQCGNFQCPPEAHPEGNPPRCVPNSRGDAPGFCSKNDDGTFTCKPPSDCADCRPPPSCDKQTDGSYRCKPQEGGANGPGGSTRGGPPPCAPPGANETPKPCGPPAGCTPESPCHADAPAFCEKQADGAMLCSPPPECAGKVGTTPQCTPPPNCAPQGDKFLCKPFETHGGPQGAPGDRKNGTFRDPCAGRPVPPTVTSENMSDPCQGGGGHANQPPPCTPKPDGTLSCTPPPQCGGSAFAAAAGDGCQAPAFCKKTDAGTFDCKPPEECRETAGGWQKCYAPATGVACEKALQDYAAAGQFTPCGAPPTQFCPPPPPGSTQPPKCSDPGKPPHPCAVGEAQFPPDHPAGTPPVCYLAGRIDGGKYVPPGDANKDCVAPPPGEWPPAQPAPDHKVWCPPQGYAPPPLNGTDFHAWENFTRDHAPPGVNDLLQRFGNGFSGLNESQLEEIHRAGVVNHLFAPPQFDGRSVNGSFVRSTFTDGLGIRNYSVGGVEFFHSANPRGGGNATFSTTVGSAAVAAGDGLVLESHNTGSGAMVYRRTEGHGVDIASGNVHVDFNPSFFPDHNVSFSGGVVLRNGDWRGVLIGNASVLPNGTIDMSVNGSRPAIFMAIPPTGLDHDTRLDIAHGVADGKVFGEVSLVARNHSIGQDLTLYAPNASAFSVEVKEHSEDAVNLSITGEGEGQALVFTVDRSTLTTPLADFNVTMDGATMRECTNFTELEGAAAKGGCFTLNANQTALRVTVMPEHFSSHLISLGAVRPVTSTAASSSAGSGTSDKGSGTTTPTGSATDTTKTVTTPISSTPASAPAAAARTPGIGTVGVIVAPVAVVAIVGRRQKK